MTVDEFNHVMRELKKYGAYVGFISGGEATLVPGIEDMLVSARSTFKYATTLVTGLYHREDVIMRIAEVCLNEGIHIQTSFDGLGETGDEIRGVKDFAGIVSERMKMISGMRSARGGVKKKKSYLYANVVISNKNMDQIPDILAHVRSLGWKATIGMYHHLTGSTRDNDEMTIRTGQRLGKLMDFLKGNPDIMNLPAYIQGIEPYVNNPNSGWCPFVRSPFLSTRLTIMENGDMHLCKGAPIGNIFRQSVKSVFSGTEYKTRISEYRKCSGCWTTCYTQRYLLVHPGSFIRFLRNLGHLRKIQSANR